MQRGGASSAPLPVRRVDEAVLTVGGAVVLDRLNLPRDRAILQYCVNVRETTTRTNNGGII